MRRTIVRLSLFIGLALFVLAVWRSGPRPMLAAVGRLTMFQWAVLAGLRLVYWILRTFNWKQVFDLYEDRQPFHRLFEARIADNAVGFITPSAMLGGLPVRALLLPGLDRRRVFASAVLDKTIEIFTLAAASVLAMLAAMIVLPMPGSARLIFGLFIVLASALCLGLLAGQRRGFFLGIIDRLARLGVRPRWVEKIRPSLRDVDDAIAGFHRDHRAAIPAVAALYTLSYFVWAFEIDVTLRFLGAPGLTLVKSLLVVSLGNVALLLPTVPASLGVYEVTNVGVFAVLGWPAGLAIALSIIRRLLALAWTAAGLAVLGLRRRDLEDRRREKTG
ncbi:MAG: lysylphosphatidylglycerol synthase transmembrane domain-containing protein [Candidatus Aminicenantales bacterium]